MKVNIHAISIKHLELQMAQLSATVNTRQPGTLPSKIPNQKNNEHCMSITTRDVKQTIDPIIPSSVEKTIRDDATAVEFVVS